MFKRTVLSLFCSIAILAAAYAAPMIVPGKGITEASLGMSRKNVEAKLGAPQDMERNEFRPTDVYVCYYNRGIELVYTNDQVSMITLHGADKQWKAYAGATKEGLSVMTPPANVPKILGNPNQSREGVMTYSKLGLIVQVKNNKIDVLIVRPPGA